MNLYVGWDIGGAHLKMVAVDIQGSVVQGRQWPAPIWQGLDRLRQAFVQASASLPSARLQHAITMTGELADCFPDRSTGVHALLEESQQCLGEVQVYSTAGLLSLSAAHDHTQRVASANWHASASWLAGQYRNAVLMDIGSTTTDIIPIRNGSLANRGDSDRRRMQLDELVYSGVVRTPVVAVAQRAVVEGVEQHLAAEQFALMADVYRILELLPDGTDQMPTADGGERTIAASRQRLARMAGADADDCPVEAWHELALYLKDCQVRQLTRALTGSIEASGLPADTVVIGAGCGRFLAREIAQGMGREYVDALERLNRSAGNTCQATDMLPAFALAERLRHNELT